MTENQVSPAFAAAFAEDCPLVSLADAVVAVQRYDGVDPTTAFSPGAAVRWTDHVGEGMRRAWATLSLESRLVAFAAAVDAFDRSALRESV
jgi:hypothetical protein